MLNPPDMPGIPYDDTIRGFSDGLGHSAAVLSGLPAETAPVPGLNAVWLAANACLMQSHIPAPANEVPVITVVGVAEVGMAGMNVLLVG